MAGGQAPKIGLKEAPYGKDGSLLHYPERWSEPRWQANDPFHATLKVDDMRSGRSAKYLILAHPNSDDARVYPMFVVDLLDMLSRAVIDHGIISGRWQVRKRGQNYGLAYLGPS